MTMILEVPHFGGEYALPYKEVIDKITVYTLSVIYLSVGIFFSKKLLWIKTTVFSRGICYIKNIFQNFLILDLKKKKKLKIFKSFIILTY